MIDYLVFEPVSRIAVRRSGDMAALRYKVSFDLVAGGTRVTHKGWITELWERRNGRWLIVSVHKGWTRTELFLRDLHRPDGAFQVQVAKSYR